MKLEMQVPLDNGFLRRECPHCWRQFKWYAGATKDKPADFVDPGFYFCPFCGKEAKADSWWTREQLEQVKSKAFDYVIGSLQSGMSQAVNGSKYLTFRPGTQRKITPRLVERNDMMVSQSPCHGWEPIKVPTSSLSVLHCLICGTAYGVTSPTV